MYRRKLNSFIYFIVFSTIWDWEIFRGRNLILIYFIYRERHFYFSLIFFFVFSLIFFNPFISVYLSSSSSFTLLIYIFSPDFFFLCDWLNNRRSKELKFAERVNRWIKLRRFQWNSTRWHGVRDTRFWSSVSPVCLFC